MRDVRNKQLQNRLNKLGIKDVVLNFDSGYVSVWSEDDLINTILHYADNTIETRTFSDYTVDEWVDDNINYSDPEQARFTKQYGKLYDFKYDWDYTFGDKGELIVWDDGGSLNWFEDDSVKNFIVKLAKKYGWYCEPCHSSSDFMFAEL